MAVGKIRRLNTAWSLGVGENPCYLRAKVVDPFNNSIPGVRISFSTAHVGNASPHVAMSGQRSELNYRDVTRSSRRHKRGSTSMFSSYVEELTGTRSFPNGVCLPVGCHDSGMLQASRLGNELVLLEPDTPSSNMGKIEEMHGMVENSSAFQNITIKLDTSLLYNTTNLTSHYAYFRSEDDCRTTSPLLQTYVFRDNHEISDGSALSRYSTNFQNNVILTFGMPSLHHSNPKPVLKYCHMKARVRFARTFSYQHSLHLEVVTYNNRTTNSGSTMVLLGWRSVPLKPPVVFTDGFSTQLVCVEFLCGEVQLTDREQLELRVTIRKKHGASYNSLSCFFSSNHEHLFNRTTESVTPRDTGGYVFVRKMFNVRTRSYRTTSHREISNEYSAATLAESNQKCRNSSPNDNVSAFFDCL